MSAFVAPVLDEDDEELELTLRRAASTTSSARSA